MEHLGFLFAAYSIVFAVIFFYVIFLWRRQAQLEAELKALEGKLESGPPAASPPRSTP